MNAYQLDRQRGGELPPYQYFYRKASSTPPILRLVNKLMLRLFSLIYNVEIAASTRIGPGLYIGHPYGITINPKATIGRNCNIHKGVTIGQENRGPREGVPTIGNEVWIGVNATIVGRITIGDDVLIAPNSYVNRDVPSHSVVFGNPCVIKPRPDATAAYINHKI